VGLVGAALGDVLWEMTAGPELIDVQ
jgi:hypothetical protein